MDGNIRKQIRAAIFIVIVIILVPYVVTELKGTVADTEFNDALIKAVGGDSDAQLRLAGLYDNGMFTEASRISAHYWYRISAQNGNGIAQYVLCGNYEIGCE